MLAKLEAARTAVKRAAEKRENAQVSKIEEEFKAKEEAIRKEAEERALRQAKFAQVRCSTMCPCIDLHHNRVDSCRLRLRRSVSATASCLLPQQSRKRRH